MQTYIRRAIDVLCRPLSVPPTSTATLSFFFVVAAVFVAAAAVTPVVLDIHRLEHSTQAHIVAFAVD